MTKKEVIEALCELCSKVGAEKFHHSLASDCFCGKSGFEDPTGYKFDRPVLEFIQEAVEEKLSRD